MAMAAARDNNVILVGRLRCDAASWDLPGPGEPGKRGRGRPRIYGDKRISLPGRAGHPKGWQTVECVQYGKEVTKTVKTFVATWRPAAGKIRVVIVEEEDGWIAYGCTDPQASVVQILEAAAGRTSIEETFKDVKEVQGAGQQQLRYWRANVGAYHLCLWGYTTVEWWAWDKEDWQVCDRDDSPWDNQPRRPSHRDKRKAMQKEMLRQEFWLRWGERPCDEEIRELIESLLNMAA